LTFCIILAGTFSILVAVSSNLLNLQFDQVQADYHRYQAQAAAEAGLAHAHAAVETSKASLDVTPDYGTRYRVTFTECTTVGLKKLWSVTSVGWSIDRETVWTVQQNLIETLPGGSCDVVQGTWSLSLGELTAAACP